MRNRCLADTGLAQKHRVVLGAPSQNTDGAFQLLLTADQGVQLALARHGCQVLAVGQRRFQLQVLELGGDPGLSTGTPTRRSGAFGILLAGDGFGDLLGHGLLGIAIQHFPQKLAALAIALANDGAEKMRGADGGAARLPGAFDGILEHMLRIGGEGDLQGFATLTVSDHELQVAARIGQFDAEFLQRPGADIGSLGDHADRQHLGADVVLAQASRL
mmetsp:Transcript_72086/g.203518  ORF Transcript_72086/g.203518 Transcript_72086/m.203518 type:complete len:217 (+) Transcript_72086:1291-1941(+)